MKKAIKSIRTAALFVGSVVGAGFATGQEVRLFFGESGVFDLVVASLFIALCAFAFLDMGARGVRFDPCVTLAVDTVVTISSFAVYAAMIAAADGVLLSLTGQKGLSVLLALAMMLFGSRGAERLSYLNLVAVPMMAAIIAAVGWKGGGAAAGEIHLVRALAYGGMNLLFSGALMVQEGRDTSFGERLGSSLLAGGLLFVMLLFMWRSVRGEGAPEMPFLTVASRGGVGTLAAIALLLAIVTTMASCAYLVTGNLTRFVGDPLLSALLVPFLGIVASTAGFAVIVEVTYPIVSVLGLAFTLVTLVFFVIARIRARRRKGAARSANRREKDFL